MCYMTQVVNLRGLFLDPYLQFALQYFQDLIWSYWSCQCTIQSIQIVSTSSINCLLNILSFKDASISTISRLQFSIFKTSHNTLSPRLKLIALCVLSRILIFSSKDKELGKFLLASWALYTSYWTNKVFIFILYSANYPSF